MDECKARQSRRLTSEIGKFRPAIMHHDGPRPLLGSSGPVHDGYKNRLVVLFALGQASQPNAPSAPLNDAGLL